MGSLLTNRRIALAFHSATARMSEGKAGANGALRVEFSTFLEFTWGSAQTRETGFLGSLLQVLLGGGLRTSQGN